jgi:hypothetical protein
MRRRLLLVPLCILGAACVTPVRSDTALISSRDLLLAREIGMSRATDIYQAIAQLRPEFLKYSTQGRGLADRDAIRVFLDNMELGSVDLLHAMSVDRVTAIRYVRDAHAMPRWGTSNTRGVILISTSRSTEDVTP